MKFTTFKRTTNKSKMNNLPQAGTSSAATKHHHQENPIYYPVIDQGHLPAAAISGSNDLLSLFNVSSMYDWFVKPYLKPIDHPNKLINSNISHPDLKGKGKADNETIPGLSPAQLENLGQKRNKMEKSYGRNSIKKDHQLETWISDPSFQESSIENFLKPFSSEVLCQSFTLQPGIYPGADSSIWVAEEGGPKKRRKKRKQGEMLAGSNPTQATGATFPNQQQQQQQQQQPQHRHQQIPNGHSTGPLMSTTTPYPSAHPTRTTSRTSITDSSSHHHINSQLNLHQHPLPVHSQHSPTTTPLCREDDYRKKKRVKINNSSNAKSSNNNSSNNPNSTNNNNNTNTGPNHQVALQS
ncbi:hypothetical protein PSTT_10356 [Puccinia striiformis]|uniref:Mediator of RNA polymerase II transcription subunit 19 n=1 Tax=Puccinia striiformis TaxID=27350 RepID=A0A2S4V4I8_9BASI|nr:hypothetical protein PSTT_10356 [Puccinia striiformis]